MRNIWRLLRLYRFPMTFAPVGAYLVGVFEAVGAFAYSGPTAWGTLALTGISAGTFAFNGYMDRDIDVEKGDPFASEHPRSALAAAITAYAIGGFAALFTGPFGSWFLVMAGCTIAYSRFLAKIPVLKNVTAAFLSSALILLGGVSAGAVGGLHVVTALVIFFAIVAMEIVKDIEDEAADRGHRITLPMLFSLNALRPIITVCIVAAIIIALQLPFPTPAAALLFLLSAFPYLLAVVTLRSDSRSAHRSRRLIYAGLWLGLLMFLVQAGWSA